MRALRHNHLAVAARTSDQHRPVTGAKSDNATHSGLFHDIDWRAQLLRHIQDVLVAGAVTHGPGFAFQFHLFLWLLLPHHLWCRHLRWFPRRIPQVRCGASIFLTVLGGRVECVIRQWWLALIQDGLAASKFVDLLRRQPFMGVEAVRSGRRVNNAGIAKMPPTTAMKAIALPGEARAMSKSLRSDGCGSGVTSERQCGQSLASSRMGSAQNGHKRLPRWLSADFERELVAPK